MSTNFFEQQDAARRRTGWLVLFFVLAVVSIILAVYVVVALLVSAGDAHGPPGSEIQALWNPPLLAGVSVAVLAVILLGSLYRLAQLASGGEAVALLLGGRLIDPQTTDLAERRLLNVVEEMALASGVPMPPVYVLDQESSINAFAAGHQPGDAVIGVSRGCLEYLTRDELQGVMAHEFSHILNGDMRLDMRLAGAIFGILILAILGYYLIRIAAYAPRSNKKEGGGLTLALLLFGVALLVIGYLGVFFGKLIKASVSRQREYLADSAAVQFTRYPAGIAGALKKIGGLPQSSRIRDVHAEEVSHMFFSDVFEGKFFNFLATHPPLVDRIQRIDPAFDGRFPEVVRLSSLGPLEAESARLAGSKQQAAEIRDFLGATADQKRRRTAPASPAQAIARIGTPQLEQLLYASALVAAMPPPLVGAAHDPYSARALVYALLLDREDSMRQGQLAGLKRHVEEQSYRETGRLSALVDQLSDEARAPLVDMAFPALKRLSPAQYRTFRENVESLVQADAKVDLFEYMIRTMLLRNLDVHFGRARPTAPRYVAIEPLVEPLRRVLSLLAHAGQESPEAARRAFEQGMAAVKRQATILPREECTLKTFDAALNELAQAAPKVQKLLVGACVATIAADGKVTVKESELLRAVSGTLGCPVPPIPLPAAPTEATAAS